jgi:hypothetical protein
LEDIDTLIDTYINDANKMSVKNEILKHYCKVFNYKSELKDFIEKISINYGDCLGISENAEFWRIRPTLEDSYSKNNGLAIKVKGVILNVQTHTLRTPSVVADALLGQGEALDCFNAKLQDAAAVKTHLENAIMLQQMEIVNAIEDSKDKASAYKKVFGTCCASDVIVPQ